MKNNGFFLFILILGITAAPIFASIPDFSDWKKRCDTIPHYKDLITKNPFAEHDYSHGVTHYHEFMAAVSDVTHAYKDSDLTNPARWVGNNAFKPVFFENKTKAFDPYIQALCVAPGTEIIMFGDRHGDARSTVAMIKELRKKGYFDASDSFILKPGVLLVGLGDYVDRGNSGAETFLTMLWLKLKNPEQVILVRGNHEDCCLSTNISQFQLELQQKLGKLFTADDVRKVNRIYDYMPVAVFIGSGSHTVNFLVGCHGFIELGYDPDSLLKLAVAHPGKSVFEKMGTLKRATHAKKLSKECKKGLADLAHSSAAFSTEMGDEDGITLTSPRAPLHLGWMWSYTLVNDSKTMIAYNSGNNTWQWGKKLTENVLELWSGTGYAVSWIFRGHQHAHNYEYGTYGSIMDKLWAHDGIYRLWADDGHAHSLSPYGAFTLNVAPDNIYAGYTPQSTYPGFNYDTWVVVKTGTCADNWSMKVINKPMFSLPEYPIWVDGKKIVPQKQYC